MFDFRKYATNETLLNILIYTLIVIAIWCMIGTEHPDSRIAFVSFVGFLFCLTTICYFLYFVPFRMSRKGRELKHLPVLGRLSGVNLPPIDKDKNI